MLSLSEPIYGLQDSTPTASWSKILCYCHCHWIWAQQRTTRLILKCGNELQEALSTVVHHSATTVASILHPCASYWSVTTLFLSVCEAPCCHCLFQTSCESLPQVSQWFSPHTAAYLVDSFMIYINLSSFAATADSMSTWNAIERMQQQQYFMAFYKHAFFFPTALIQTMCSNFPGHSWSCHTS